MVKMRRILINANYGWEGGNRSAVIKVPEIEMDDVEKYVHNWIMESISWYWEDITGENKGED